MTERERAILTVLQQEPTIAQKDLAKRLGIERSSVAVHIANLTKKGYIQGKGYIVNAAVHVAVVGGTNMDVVGRAPMLLSEDSALGEIEFSAGGVGRNIAEALARLDVPTKLFSAVGADVNGDHLLRLTREAGVDTGAVHVAPSLQTGVYMAMLGANGDMAYAINAMGITEAISPGYLQQHMGLLKHARYVVVDANLSPAALEALAHAGTAPLIADPVSAGKAKKLLPHLSKLFGIKPNRLEAQVLTGIEVVDVETACQAVAHLMAQGVQQVVLTLGEAGVVAACSREGVLYHFEMPKVDVVNATGAGDVFTAGWVSALHAGLPFAACMRRAIAAAAVNLGAKQTIHPALGLDALQKYESEVALNERILRYPS